MPSVLVFGSCSAQLQLLKQFADDLHATDPSLLIDFETLVEADWLEVLPQLKRQCGGSAFQHSSSNPFVIHSIYGYIPDFLTWACSFYQLPDPRAHPSFGELESSLRDDASQQLQQWMQQRSSHKFAFMDVQIGNAAPERIIFELYADLLPRTCDNFLKLCTGEVGALPSETFGGAKLCYAGNRVHRVVRDGWFQAGDIINHRGDSGHAASQTERTFADESFVIDHNRRGVLSMCNDGPHTNHSQFLVTLGEGVPQFNRRYVAFGRVCQGMSVLAAINNVATKLDAPQTPIVLTKCGRLEVSNAVITDSTPLARSNKTSSSSTSSTSSAAPSREFTFVVCGQLSSGKTTFCNSLRGEGLSPTTETMGFELVKFPHRSSRIRLFGLGGHPKICGYWVNYYDEVHGCVYVIDANSAQSSSNIETSQKLLHELATNPLMTGKPILIISNHLATGGSHFSEAELRHRWQLDQLKSPVEIKPCVCHHEPVDPHALDGLDWLIQQVQKQPDIDSRIAADILTRDSREQARLEAMKAKFAARRAAAEAAAAASVTPV